MTAVLLIGATRPAPLALGTGVRELTGRGAVVDAALLRDDPDSRRGLGLRTAHVMKPTSGLSATGRPARGTPRWWRATVRVGLRDRVAPRLDLSGRTWLTARLDPWVLSRAAEADLVVALDRYAVFTAWKLARRNRRLAVVHGLDAAVHHLEGAETLDRRNVSATVGVS